jgi:hypothetical protein
MTVSATTVSLRTVLVGKWEALDGSHSFLGEVRRTSKGSGRECPLYIEFDGGDDV